MAWRQRRWQELKQEMELEVAELEDAPILVGSNEVR